MNVEVTTLPESRVTLKIELTPQEVDQALDRTYKQLVSRVNVPGFRKGKAPRPIVERMVGPEFFLHEATEEAIRWGYRKAIDQADVAPIDEAEIEPSEQEHVEPGEGFQFEATVAVKPHVQLPDYHAIRIPQIEPQVSEEDVNTLLHDLQERNATLEPTIQPAEIGSVVTMTILGKVGGEEIINSENYEFELQNEDEEPDLVLPGLSKGLVGIQRGEIREISLPLPELYPDQELAGKTMFVRVLAKEIKRKVLPPLNDEFAQSVSQFQTLDELREALRANLLAERRAEADEKLVSEAVEAVTSRSFVEIPPVLIEEELDRMMDDLRRAFESRHLSFETYLETSNKTRESIGAEMHEDAVNNVKTSLVLGALADAEHIEISNKEVEAELEALLRLTGASSAERKRLRSSANVRANIRSRLRRQRTTQKLVEIVTGVSVPPEATEAVTEQTAAAAEDTQETVAVEVGG